MRVSRVCCLYLVLSLKMVSSRDSMWLMSRFRVVSSLLRDWSSGA